jgi:hypothetical protein
METTLDVLTVVIAISVAIVAWQNYRIGRSNFYIAKDKLRLDLFDRRLKVFEACQKLFSFVLREGRPTSAELTNFLERTANSEFLFGKDIRNYIEEVQVKGLKIIQLNRRLDSERLEVGDIRTKLAYELSDLEEWFINQFKESREIFRKYLHFTIDKNP